MSSLRIGPHEISISNPDRIFFPRDGLTKMDVIDYYARIAEYLLPHTRERPLSMERYPDGIGREGFYQKEIPDYFPSWIDRVRVDLKDGGSQLQVTGDQAATLVFIAEQACITPHTWMSRRGHLNVPDKMIFDLDPPATDFEPVRKAAFLVREFASELGLPSSVMTTGSHGLHIVIPLIQSENFTVVRSFAHEMAESLASRHAKTLTTEIRKEKRQGRVFIDVLRNAYAQTSVPPYALRARDGAPVATPIAWDELEDPGLHAGSFTVRNIFDRLETLPDPWKGLHEQSISLEPFQEILHDHTGLSRWETGTS